MWTGRPCVDVGHHTPRSESPPQTGVCSCRSSFVQSLTAPLTSMLSSETGGRFEKSCATKSTGSALPRRWIDEIPHEFKFLTVPLSPFIAILPVVWVGTEVEDQPCCRFDGVVVIKTCT